MRKSNVLIFFFKIGLLLNPIPETLNKYLLLTNFRKGKKII